MDEATVRRGLILSAGRVEVEVYEDQLNAIREVPKGELDESMMVTGVVWMKKQLRAEYAMTHQALTEDDQEVLNVMDLRLELNEDFDHLTTTALSSPYENGAAARVVHGVRRILSKWDDFILQPRKGELVPLGRTNPGPGVLPLFMVKLFSRKIDQLAKGASVGGGADHEGGGEKTGRVVIDYSVEEEEEIEEDTSRQAQHGASGPGGDANQDEDSSSGSSSGSSSSDESVEDDGEGAGHRTERTGEHGVALGERVDERVELIEQQATWETKAVEEQEGGAAAQEGGVGGQQQVVGEAAAQEGGAGGQQEEGVAAAQEERNPLEGARAKIDEMSGKIIEGVAAAITKASEDAVEKQLKQVEERLVAAVLKGFEKAIMEDMFCSTLPPETMKELKDIVREGYHEAEAGRLEVLTEAMARGFQRSAGPSTRSRQEGVGGVHSGAEPRGHERSVPPSSSVGRHVGSPFGSPPARGRHPVAKPVEEVIVLDQSALPKTSVAAPIDPPDAFASMRDMLQGLGKTGGGAGKGAGEASVGLLSKTKATSAAHGGGAGLAVGLVGNWASSSTPPVAPVAAAPSLGNVCLSDPSSPSTSKKKSVATKSSKRAAHATESLDVVELASVPGQAPVEKTSIVVAARQEKAKKARVTGHAPPPRPDDQGKTRGCKRPFKGPGFGLRKGKPVSEQTVGGRKRFLGTFETEKDQKFCTAVCWRVYFPDVVLTEYEGYTAQDEEDWKVYLDAAVEMPTGVWSVAQEQGECRFDEKLSREDIKKDVLAAANAAIYAPETAKKACVAAMSALVSILLHVGKTFPAKQWPDHLHSSAVEGLGSMDAILLQMLRVAAQVCTQWCCCRATARLLEDAGYGSLAMPEEKSKAKQGDEDAAETETGGQGE
ncbi:unnamed protein product [Closterium sp. NIES-64]|nr:unnamed protein product [Closterium sp. NIES-64]